MSKENQNPNQNPETKNEAKSEKKNVGEKKKSGAQVHNKNEAKKKKSASAENTKSQKKPQPEEAKPAKKAQPEEAKPAKKAQPEEAKPAKKAQPEEAKPAKKAQPEEAKPAKKAQPEEAKPAKKPTPEAPKPQEEPQAEPSEAKPEKKKAPAPQEPGAGGKRAMDILLSVLLIGAIGAGAWYVASSGSTIDHTTTYVTEATVPEETTSPTEEGKTIYQTEMHQNTDIYMGDLILVNPQCEYKGSEEGLVSLYEKKQEADSHSFSVRDGELLVRENVAEQLIAMFEGFYGETFDDNIIVQTGYRSRERQQELYDEDLELTGESFSERVSKPGHSEHQTGYCVDLSLVGGEDYDGTGVYEWINKHCYEYGFVLRYENRKSPLTEVKAEPWHYRYVGAPHAFYMMSKGLCLEEYMMELKEYSYEGEHLSITNFDGTIYEVYYVAADAAYDSTMVPVPGSLEYTVSGNNEDGFIVTVNTGETGDKPAAPTEAPTEATEAETSDTTETTTESEEEDEEETTASSQESDTDSGTSSEDADSEADETSEDAGESSDSEVE